MSEWPPPQAYPEQMGWLGTPDPADIEFFDPFEDLLPPHEAIEQIRHDLGIGRRRQRPRDLPDVTGLLEEMGI